MSVQLILYPQSFDGVPNAFSAANSEMIVNGSNFSSFNANTTSYSATTTLAQTAVNALVGTATSNTWYAFDGTGGAVAGTPTAAVFAGYAGCMQRITNLVTGAVYDVTLVVQTFPITAGLTLRIYNGVTLVSSTPIPATTTLTTVQFTAPSANNTTFVIDFYDPTTPTGFGSVSVKMASTQPSGAIELLENGQVICDLYEDEDIPLSLSVDNFKNVAEKVQSYSKAFNLPATKRNNQIFNQMYEVTRSDDGIIFNPYVKTQCVLKQDGFLLFEGYMRMLDISDKEGEISYNVNLYSEVVALADILKDRTFSDLDFTELEHDYNITQIKYSWNNSGAGITYLNPSTSGFRHANSTVKYPFCDWTHKYTVNSIGNPEIPNLESAFRPFIRLKYLVDRIFNAPSTPFSYTSAFFNGTDFEALYMDFNWGADNAPVNIESTQTARANASTLASASYTTMPQDNNTYNANFGYSSGVYTAQVDNQTYNVSFAFTTKIQNVAGVDRIINGTARWKIIKSGVTTYSNIQNFAGVVPASSSTGVMYSGNFVDTLNTGDTLTPEFTESLGQVLWTSQSALPNGQTFDTVVSISSPIITTSIILQTLRGELGQWEFLQGIMTMFNLVTLVDPDNPNNLLIEPYADVFIRNTVSGNIFDMTLASRGITHDWTDKIDVSQMKLEPLTDLNKKTIFKFVEDDDDFCFMEYKRQIGGHLYGSKVWDATAFTVLDGEDEVIAEPFAATIPARLMPQYSDFIVPKLYASSDDETEGFDNSPRIMYNNGIHDLSSCTYHIPSQNGVAFISAEDQYLRFSHLTKVPTVTGSTSDFHFGECQLDSSIGNSTPDNLFNGYWLPYYAELYNANTRTMTIKVNLNAGDISTFKFNDTVMLKNRQYRVNKIEYKPNDLATVEFILIQ
tara:strand:- start:503 stop:3214 length:2712 start_codon:yes stop_codon:yes gene_type:complete